MSKDYIFEPRPIFSSYTPNLLLGSYYIEDGFQADPSMWMDPLEDAFVNNAGMKVGKDDNENFYLNDFSAEAVLMGTKKLDALEVIPQSPSWKWANYDNELQIPKDIADDDFESPAYERFMEAAVGYNSDDPYFLSVVNSFMDDGEDVDLWAEEADWNRIQTTVLWWKLYDQWMENEGIDFLTGYAEENYDWAVTHSYELGNMGYEMPEPDDDDYYWSMRQAESRHWSYDKPMTERQRYRIRKLGGRIDKSMNRSDASRYIKSLMVNPLHAEGTGGDSKPTCEHCGMEYDWDNIEDVWLRWDLSPKILKAYNIGPSGCEACSEIIGDTTSGIVPKELYKETDGQESAEEGWSCAMGWHGDGMCCDPPEALVRCEGPNCREVTHASDMCPELHHAYRNSTVGPHWCKDCCRTAYEEDYADSDLTCDCNEAEIDDTKEAENEGHWMTFGRVDYNWATDPDDVELTDEEFWEIDENIRNEVRYEIDTNNLPGESNISSSDISLSLTEEDEDDFTIYYYWGPAETTGVNSAETFEAPYTGAGALMGISGDSDLSSFTSKELTESSAIHGDFDQASLNYSGHQNLEVRAEAVWDDEDYYDPQDAWERSFETWMEEWVTGGATRTDILRIYAAKNGIVWSQVDEVDVADATAWYEGLTIGEREDEIFTTTGEDPFLHGAALGNVLDEIIADQMDSWDDQFQ